MVVHLPDAGTAFGRMLGFPLRPGAERKVADNRGGRGVALAPPAPIAYVSVMDTPLPATDAAPLAANAGPDELARAVEAAERDGQRIIVTRGGKPAAALVSLEDLQALEALEDARDAEAVRKGLEAYEREGHTWPTLEEVAARYGIKL